MPSQVKGPDFMWMKWATYRPRNVRVLRVEWNKLLLLREEEEEKEGLRGRKWTITRKKEKIEIEWEISVITHDWKNAVTFSLAILKPYKQYLVSNQISARYEIRLRWPHSSIKFEPEKIQKGWIMVKYWPFDQKECTKKIKTEEPNFLIHQPADAFFL